VSFTYPAGTIDGNDTAQGSFRVHQANYSGIFDQSDDYSFNESPALVSSGTITLHLNDEIIWGTAP
jgi:hypothetical protein